MTCLVETTIHQTIEESYAKLKDQITKTNCRIISEEKPHKISVTQGSVWGTTPRSAQKTITFALQEDAAATRINGKSTLTENYISLTVVGIVFSIVLLIVCVWLALDLQAFSSTGSGGFWSWLVQTQGSFDSNKSTLFITLAWFLTAFLAATLAAEAFVVARVKSRIDSFAREIFKTISPPK